jgi:hypothetical protein
MSQTSGVTLKAGETITVAGVTIELMHTGKLTQGSDTVQTAIIVVKTEGT